MSNSKLVTYTKLSPNHSGTRTHEIDTITIHHMAGNLSVKQCGEIFAKSASKASSNYSVNGKEVGLYVDEKNRAWTSSNRSNDQRAITIEVANTDIGVKKKTWEVSNESMETLIQLVADICKRNNIKKLVWVNNKYDRIAHRNGANMTIHKDFTATLCPGPYLESRMGYIATMVNDILEPKKEKLYRVQIGAYQMKKNAEVLLETAKIKYKDAFIREEYGLYKVQIGAYKTEKNAKAAVKRAIDNGYKDAFIIEE